MDEATATAIIGFATVALPLAVGGIVWLEKKVKALIKKLGLSDEQGDLIVKMAQIFLGFIKGKYPADKARIEKAEEIVKKIVATWEDPVGTTAMMEGYLKELEQLLRE